MVWDHFYMVGVGGDHVKKMATQGIQHQVFIHLQHGGREKTAASPSLLLYGIGWQCLSLDALS